ncbi:endopeptidase [[Pantoea] beijingensis]|uniref:Endopeptidase n=1 Tax=[Pantoea] beijingensis TaxID=1324864 RepID=A0A443IHM9_9GAMM|nr:MULTISPECIES: C40 family peptidase [Erwiniaceae]RWR03532.1 endopeptidase [[Pantoea] beijingensis]
MRLLITLFMLAFAQLFFNMAHASPHASVTANQHKKVDKSSPREDERRKRRQVKTSPKKARTASIQKVKLKKKPSLQTAAVATPHVISGKKPLIRHYGKQRKIASKAPTLTENGSLTLSTAHRVRYQKARETAMNKLMGQLGKPYLWGGTSPHTGFDCSGLVWYAYKDLVKFKIPRTANEMYHLRDAATINREALEKGDLVFFRINNRGAADHVGVYLGNGKFIQSPRTGKDIQISALGDDYWQRHYVGARRVMTPKTIR